jgi:hypothetical protein
VSDFLRLPISERQLLIGTTEKEKTISRTKANKYTKKKQKTKDPSFFFQYKINFPHQNQNFNKKTFSTTAQEKEFTSLLVLFTISKANKYTKKTKNKGPIIFLSTYNQFLSPKSKFQ